MSNCSRAPVATSTRIRPTSTLSGMISVVIPERSVTHHETNAINIPTPTKKIQYSVDPYR